MKLLQTFFGLSKKYTHSDQAKESRAMILPLSNSMICLDCEMIFSVYVQNGDCPVCGSGATRLLSEWIGTLNHDKADVSSYEEKRRHWRRYLQVKEVVAEAV